MRYALLGLALVIWPVAIARASPLLGAQRFIIHLRAIWMLLGEMIDGAMARTDRWKECVDRARRNA